MKSKFAKELLSYMSSISKPLKYIRYFIKKNDAIIIKMVGKIYHKKPQGFFKVYIKIHT